MSDKFSEQKDALLSIKHEISLLHQQVEFLLRNEKEVGLLDLDVMMNRTHTIYDKMCAIDIGNYPAGDGDEMDFLPSFEEEDEKPMVEEEEPIEEEEEPVVEEEEEPVVEENEDAYFEEEVEEEPQEVPTVELQVEPQEEPKVEPQVEPQMEPQEEPVVESKTDADNLGFILDFEPTEDHSLAAKLQHESITDLRSAIGINDKFLLVNELFGGSMEKYNKSIDNLNDLKTLNGALVYMNELRIELQWNSNNEAYKKLLDLVHRKFE